MLLEIISEDLDILFINEEEAKTLTDLAPKEACSFLAELCPTVVVTMGESGGYVGSGEDLIYYPPVVANLVDDTGAGDLFMSGFLHGILNGNPLDECARHGALIASKVIQVVGAELPEEARSCLSLQEAHVGNHH